MPWLPNRGRGRNHATGCHTTARNAACIGKLNTLDGLRPLERCCASCSRSQPRGGLGVLAVLGDVAFTVGSVAVTVCGEHGCLHQRSTNRGPRTQLVRRWGHIGTPVCVSQRVGSVGYGK